MKANIRQTIIQEIEIQKSMRFGGPTSLLGTEHLWIYLFAILDFQKLRSDYIYFEKLFSQIEERYWL